MHNVKLKEVHNLLLNNGFNHRNLGGHHVYTVSGSSHKITIPTKTRIEYMFVLKALKTLEEVVESKKDSSIQRFLC